MIGPNLTVELGRIKLKNPVVTCSGTFASGKEFADFFDISRLGAIATKSYSIKKREGNKPPRLFETKCGLINSIGLQNQGIDHFINEELPFLVKSNASIILSLFGLDTKSFVEVVKRVKEIQSHLKAVELNLSCPNIEQDGETFCQSPDVVGDIVGKVRNILNIPIIVKLSPNTDRVVQSAINSKESGADAVAYINTLLATAIDIDKKSFVLGNKLGGLSGPAIKPIALAKIYQIAKLDILPIIGIGGIMDYRDAIEFLMLGARSVGIGTANFIEPLASDEILMGLVQYLKANEIKDINDIIGVLLNE